MQHILYCTCIMQHFRPAEYLDWRNNQSLEAFTPHPPSPHEKKSFPSSPKAATKFSQFVTTCEGCVNRAAPFYFMAWIYCQLWNRKGILIPRQFGKRCWCKSEVRRESAVNVDERRRAENKGGGVKGEGGIKEKSGIALTSTFCNPQLQTVKRSEVQDFNEEQHRCFVPNMSLLEWRHEVIVCVSGHFYNLGLHSVQPIIKVTSTLMVH